MDYRISLLFKKLVTALANVAFMWVGQSLGKHRYITAQILCRWDRISSCAEGNWSSTQATHAPTFRLQVAAAGASRGEIAALTEGQVLLTSFGQISKSICVAEPVI